MGCEFLGERNSEKNNGYPSRYHRCQASEQGLRMPQKTKNTISRWIRKKKPSEKGGEGHGESHRPRVRIGESQPPVREEIGGSQ